MKSNFQLLITNYQFRKFINRQSLIFNRNPGFTLVELLVVIGIIAVLAVVGLVVYRDLSLQAKDGTRVSDLSNVVDAVSLATHDATNSAIVFCSGIPVPCTASSFPVTSSTRNTDGTGWILVNFDVKNIASFNQLPIDPTNDATYNYIYSSDGQHWEISTVLQSAKFKDKMSSDGGNDDNRYEVGVGIKSL